MTIEIFKDNLSPSISDTLTVDGAPFDLTGCTLVFKMRPVDSLAVIVSGTANIVGLATTGKWKYDWQGTDTDLPGAYKAWLVVTLPGGKVQDTPEFDVEIVAHAPSVVKGNGWGRANARQRLLLFGQASSEPVVDSTEIELILDMSRIMDLNGSPPPKGWAWYSGINLGIGTYVIPSVPNGHIYTVTASGGAAGAVEPTWPTTSGGTVILNGVTYQESGTMVWVETFDTYYAIAQMWLLKAGRIVDHYNFMVSGKMFSRQQFYDHCMKQYRVYAGKARLKAIRLATPLTGQTLSNIPLWNDVPNNSAELY